MTSSCRDGVVSMTSKKSGKFLLPQLQTAPPVPTISILLTQLKIDRNKRLAWRTLQCFKVAGNATPIILTFLANFLLSEWKTNQFSAIYFTVEHENRNSQSPDYG
jgi:hypothetical protein